MDKKLYKLMDWPQIEAVVYSEIDDPYSVLGAKVVGNSVLFQTFIKDADKVSLIVSSNGKETSYDMEMVDEAGFFACMITGKKIPSYEYEVTYNKKIFRIKDAYFIKGFEIKDDILKKFQNGILYDSYKYFGAHKAVVNGVDGVKFSLFAPNAIGCSVLGSFNNFISRMYQMKKNEQYGIYEIFIPGAKDGDLYLYEVKHKGGKYVEKLDPYSVSIDVNEKRYSKCDFSEYEFNDEKYIKDRIKFKEPNSKISIYEINLGYFERGKKNSLLNYQKLAEAISEYVSEMGFSHVNIMPLMEYVNDSTFGYTPSLLFAPTQRYGSSNDLKKMIDIFHQNNIGVILDFVPYHFSNEEDGLSQFDGTCLYEHLDPIKGIHPFFGTRMFNFGRKEVSNYVISSAINMVTEYHIDGLRMDGVSSILYLDYGRGADYIPNIYGGNENLEGIEFIKHLNSIMGKLHKDVIMIANDDSLFPMITGKLEDGGLGFDLKMNKGLSDDYLSYISYDPYFRAHHHNELTDNMLYQYSDNLISAFSHENFIYGQGTLLEKMPGTEDEKFKNVKLSLAYLYLHPGKKYIFQGQDIGVSDEFNDNEVIDWSLLKNENNKAIKKIVKDLNALYEKYDELSVLDNVLEGFEWINCINSEQNMLSFLRKAKAQEDILMVVFNFANIAQSFKVGSNIAGKYKEIFNTDSKEYAGSNVVNRGYKSVSEIGSDGRAYSVEIKLAPLSAAVFKFVPFTEKEKYQIEKKKEASIANTRAKEFEDIAKNTELEYEEAKAKLEEVKKQMKDAELRIKKALESRDKELLKAKKALEDAM